MLTVYDCIVNAHDLRLVGLAAVICALASFTAINLLHHVRRSGGYMRQVWLCVSATSTGFGIWATHFIAMLAFSPGIPSAYNITLTTLSLIVAIFLTGMGLMVAVSIALGGLIGAAALRSGLRGDALKWKIVGALLLTAAICSLHFTAMGAAAIIPDPQIQISETALPSGWLAILV